MTRGTTPTFILTVPDTCDLTQCSNVYVTFKQPNGIVITKSGNDIDIMPHEVDVYLDQAETLMFAAGSVNVQLNFVFPGGQRACSDIAKISIRENLLPEVLT